MAAGKKAAAKVVTDMGDLGQIISPMAPPPQNTVSVGFDQKSDEALAKMARINRAKREIRESERFQDRNEVTDDMRCEQFVREFISSKPYGSEGRKVIARPAGSAFRECMNLLKACVPEVPPPGLIMHLREVFTFAKDASKDEDSMREFEAIYRTSVRKFPQFAYVFAAKVALAFWGANEYFKMHDSLVASVGPTEAFKTANTTWQKEHIATFDKYMEMARNAAPPPQA